MREKQYRGNEIGAVCEGSRFRKGYGDNYPNRRMPFDIYISRSDMIILIMSERATLYRDFHTVNPTAVWAGAELPRTGPSVQNGESVYRCLPRFTSPCHSSTTLFGVGEVAAAAAAQLNPLSVDRTTTTGVYYHPRLLRSHASALMISATALTGDSQMPFQHALCRQNIIDSDVEILNIKIELTCTVTQP